MIRNPKVFFLSKQRDASGSSDIQKLLETDLIAGDLVETWNHGIGICLGKAVKLLKPPKTPYTKWLKKCPVPLSITTRYKNCLEAFSDVLLYATNEKGISLEVSVFDEGIKKYVPDIDKRYQFLRYFRAPCRSRGFNVVHKDAVQVVFGKFGEYFEHSTDDVLLLEQTCAKKLRATFLEKLQPLKSMVFLSAVYMPENVQGDSEVAFIWNTITSQSSYCGHTKYNHKQIFENGGGVLFEASDYMYVVCCSARFDIIDQLVAAIVTSLSGNFKLLQVSDEDSFCVDEAFSAAFVLRNPFLETTLMQTLFWKKPHNLHNISNPNSPLLLVAYRVLWCRRTMLDVYICFPHLPVYIMLEILDWLGEVTHMPHVSKVAFLENICKSTRKVFDARHEISSDPNGEIKKRSGE